MGDTKRGRERQGRNKRHQRLRREMERDRELVDDPRGVQPDGDQTNED